MPDIDFSYFASSEGTQLRDKLKTQGAGFFRELSGSEYLRQLRESGAKIRDADFYSLRREVLGLNRNEERTRALREDTPIPESYINRDHSYRIQSEYLYRFRAQYYDDKQQRIVNTYASYITNERLSTEQALLELREQLDISPEENESISLGFHILSLSYVLGRNPG